MNKLEKLYVEYKVQMGMSLDKFRELHKQIFMEGRREVIENLWNKMIKEKK